MVVKMFIGFVVLLFSVSGGALLVDGDTRQGVISCLIAVTGMLVLVFS